MLDPEGAVADFLRQAEEAIADARLLMENKRPAGAVNRAYYAAFYGACALLDSTGLKANSHQATIALLHREFVRTGKLERDPMREYTRLFEARMTGDYGSYLAVNGELARECFDSATHFLDEVKRLLQSID